MSNAFFYDLLASIADRGRSMLKVNPWPKDADTRVEQLVEDCRALVEGRGEASGVALAAEVIGRYRALDPGDHAAFFSALADEFGPDRDRVRDAVAKFASDGDEARLSEIHYASEPRRHELFRRINRAPGGTAALVTMRADLLQLVKQNPSLAIVDRDFLHLFGSWFNRGFLVLRRIDWSSPAALLERIIRYEAVHEIGDWDELRRRIDPADRRCYAFFHPRLVDEPLIFVEVALTLSPPAAIAPLLAEKRAHVAPDKARVAAFYSISNCQQGLAGVNFGNFLIKQVVEEIRRELPAIETFVTLSPVPGFRAWLETTEDPAIASMKNAALQLAAEDNWLNAPGVAPRLRAAARAVGRPLLPEGAPARRPGPGPSRPLSSRQRRAARAHRLGGGPVAEGARRVLRHHGQLSLRSRRDRAQSRGLRQPRPDRRFGRGEEASSHRALAPARGFAGRFGVERVSALLGAGRR